MSRLKTLLLVVVCLLSAESCSKSKDKDSAAESTLTVTKKVTSIKIGESDKIKINQGSGTLKATTDHPCATAAIDGTDLTVTGVSLGITKVQVTDEAGQSDTLEVRVHDPKYLDVGNLLIGFTNKFTVVWTDGGSGGDHDGSYWDPVPPEGFFSLGSFGTAGYADPSGGTAVVVVKDINDSKLLAEPTDYELVWNDAGSGADADGSMWKPIPPAGYVCMGLVAQNGHGKPATSRVRCIAESLTVQGKVGSLIWDDTGTGANSDFGSWNIAPPDDRRNDMAYLPVGTFIGHASHATPSAGDNVRVLLFKLPITTAFSDTTIAPVLDGYEEPAEQSDLLLSRVVSVPFNMVTDNEKDVAWKVANSPIYQIELNAYYKKLLFHDNRQGVTSAVDSKADTVGVEKTQTDTYSQSWGITISAETGISLGAESKVSISLSYEFGFESSTSLSTLESHEVTKTLDTPPKSSAAMWQKTNRFQLTRNAGDRTEVVGNAWEIPMDSYVTAVFPR